MSNNLRDDLLTEAVSDSLLKRYDGAIDTVEGIVNNFAAKNVESITSILNPYLEKTKSELVALSDAQKDKGLHGFFRKLWQDNTKSSLEKLEQVVKDIDNAVRLAYKYTKSALSRNQQSNMPFMQLSIPDADKKKVSKLLKNAFSDSSLRAVRKAADKISQEMFTNLSLDDLKNLAVDLDGVAEAVSAASEELTAVNKKAPAKTPEQDEKAAKLAAAIGKGAGVDSKAQAVASKIVDKVESTPGTGDDMQVALSILSKLNDEQLKSVITLIKRLKATPAKK